MLYKRVESNQVKYQNEEKEGGQKKHKERDDFFVLNKHNCLTVQSISFLCYDETNDTDGDVMFSLCKYNEKKNQPNYFTTRHRRVHQCLFNIEHLFLNHYPFRMYNVPLLVSIIGDSKVGFMNCTSRKA